MTAHRRGRCGTPGQGRRVPGCGRPPHGGPPAGTASAAAL